MGAIEPEISAQENSYREVSASAVAVTEKASREKHGIIAAQRRIILYWHGTDFDSASRWVHLLWVALGTVWLVMWLRVKKSKRRESAGEQLQHIVPLLLGFWLLFNGAGAERWGRLNHPVLPEVPLTWLGGVVITAVGVAIAIWARMILNTNWSGVVALKTGHELIRKGPYRWIRHPIYTGILLAMIGTAIVRNHVRGWIGLVIVFATFYFKARREEQFLRQEFGTGFEEHSRHTGMFLPKYN
jgi:protein-S-isoprenylcysteine O-methyltransferase Ste14